MGNEAALRLMINEALDNCCHKTLPRVKAKIKDKAGRAMVETMAFNLCKSEGIAVQTALSEIDSEL